MNPLPKRSLVLLVGLALGVVGVMRFGEWPFDSFDSAFDSAFDATDRPSIPVAHSRRGLWGFAVGLYAQEASERDWTYPPDPFEVVQVGAQDILLTPSWSQSDIHSSQITPDQETPQDDDLRTVFRRARQLGLGVALMPYLRITSGGPGQWRGTIDPHDLDNWWLSYTEFIRHYARIADEEGARVFVIGSELSSMSNDETLPRWRALATAARMSTSARLAFVANHDALDLKAPFEVVDIAGVSAYFPVVDDPFEAWRGHAAILEAFADDVGKPLVLFELGFPSRQGALHRPWDHIAGTPVDLEEQALGYEAATAALADAEWLSGLFFWAWYGDGGTYDRSYSPRDKPAEAVAARFLRTRTRE